MVNENIQENVRNVLVNGNQVGCSYKEFLACNPKEYDGKRGVVVLTQWIEKMENVQVMSGCSMDQKVKYTAGSFVETELWNHAMVEAGHAAYTDRFHELARLVPQLVTPEKSKTIQKAVKISGALTDEAVGNGSIKKVEKRGNVLVEVLKEKSINKAEVLTVVEEEGSTWMTPIYEYLTEETPCGKEEGKVDHYKQTMLSEKSMKDPAYPQSNDLVERANRSLGEGMKARFDKESKDWMEEVSHVLCAHRTMIKSSNEDTPFSLTYETEAYIASSSLDKTMRVWDILNGLCIRVMYGVTTQLCMRFHPIAQMRCVSKRWNALLSQPSFIKSHLDHHLTHDDEILVGILDGHRDYEDIGRLALFKGESIVHSKELLIQIPMVFSSIFLDNYDAF
nr:hypothetical protein [Tanacetum cinerariifolium]